MIRYLAKRTSTLSSRALLATVPAVEKPFDKILIANRGEIAVRVMRTAKRLGVKTVAVYSDADSRAMHVKEADEAYCIGAAASAESYLLMDRVLDVALKTGAQAIHPGYGFLSENAKFVDMVEAAGLAFIGPSSGPMESMGDKINSKKIAKDAGCFVIPGYEGEVADEDHAAKLASDVGYPVMIKASAGGGGKGMRVAYNEAEVREGFRLSKAEALSSFGDDRMLIERFIEDPHHIEIQVLADSHGNVVAFPERECSVQRRNQKVIEESPSCLLTPATRKLMQEQAIQLCKATGYRSAGTVEMLADGDQNFYFLEMNTRLQVEHPVTEMVSGEDLVEHMLYVAAGKTLPDRFIQQPFVEAKGWSMEGRVYAEDPIRNFLPSIGPLITYSEPEANFKCGDAFNSDSLAGKDIVRVDSGVYEGGEISMYYDPMISKLITYGATRQAAMQSMASALDNYVIEGLGNNLAFLRDVIRNNKFISGHYGTKFIEEEYPEGFNGVQLDDSESRRLIAVGAMIQWLAAGPGDNNGAFVVTLPARGEQQEECCYAAMVSIGGAPEIDIDDAHSESTLTVRLWDLAAFDALPSEASKGTHFANYPIVLSDVSWQSGMPSIRVRISEPDSSSTTTAAEVEASNGTMETVTFEGSTLAGVKLRYRGAKREIIVRSPREHELAGHMLEPEVRDMSKYLVCPMPGTLISCSVSPGDSVEEGQPLAVVEAMKMQNVLRSEKTGVVSSVLCKAGQHLKVDQIILEFEGEDE